MQTLKIKNNKDYIRYSKDLEIKVNDLITVKVNAFGGLQCIESETFGDLTILEDPDFDITYYINGEETKWKGFMELYDKLFKKNFKDLESDILEFAEKEVLATYPNNIENLDRNQKIALLKEETDEAPTFKSTCNKDIVYRTWMINKIIGYLGEEKIRTQAYECRDSGNKMHGINLERLKESYTQIKYELK